MSVRRRFPFLLILIAASLSVPQAAPAAPSDGLGLLASRC
jgi:hypothetical protein